MNKKIKGYNFIKVKKEWIQEHRLNAEKKLKRKLTKSEKVHHIDLNKENNKISNLMLFPNQEEHQKFHLKLKQFGLTNPMKRQINSNILQK